MVELTSWKVDLMGVDFIGVDFVGVDLVSINPLNDILNHLRVNRA